jgi:hypothetical protein
MIIRFIYSIRKKLLGNKKRRKNFKNYQFNHMTYSYSNVSICGFESFRSLMAVLFHFTLINYILISEFSISQTKIMITLSFIVNDI